jgi:nicotinate-nucleotide pyrophosphorylase (carboxylating)
MEEDVGGGDLTGGCLESGQVVDWYVEVQADGILCGLGVAEYLFSPIPGQSTENHSLEIEASDGDVVRRGDRIVSGQTAARRALMAERTMLNFLMHFSGISTLASQFVERTSGTKARVIDTRKTIPTLRAWAKYAVRCGGGHNHRMGLYDGVLIKDNHIEACGSIRAAVGRVRSDAPPRVKNEVECANLDMVAEAVEAGAEVIMLDNMDPFAMREAVTRFQGRALFEASGGITLDTVRGVAQTGVDYISVGAITHSAPALSMHMEIR